MVKIQNDKYILRTIDCIHFIHFLMQTATTMMQTQTLITNPNPNPARRLAPKSINYDYANGLVLVAIA